MVRVKYEDKNYIVELLTDAFDCNPSVNYIVKQDQDRRHRISILMEYSFEICYRYGAIFLTEDRKACALTLFPDKKKNSLATMIQNIKLTFFCVGLNRISKVIKREAIIKTNYPKSPVWYLWFFAVKPGEQGKGIGSTLITELLKESKKIDRPIYLETSMEVNVLFYTRAGFEVFKEIKHPHQLYLIRSIS